LLLNVAGTFPIRLADGKITNLVDIERGSILDSRQPWPAGSRPMCRFFCAVGQFTVLV